MNLVIVRAYHFSPVSSFTVKKRNTPPDLCHQKIFPIFVFDFSYKYKMFFELLLAWQIWDHEKVIIKRTFFGHLYSLLSFLIFFKPVFPDIFVLHLYCKIESFSENNINSCICIFFLVLPGSFIFRVWPVQVLQDQECSSILHVKEKIQHQP